MSFADDIPQIDLEWIDRVRQRMLGLPERAYATYALTRELVQHGDEGRLIECGVFAGVHPAIMWRAAERFCSKRIIHLFDSFEGIPHAGVNDTDDIAGTLFSHGRDGALESTGISSCSVSAVKGHMEEWGVDQKTMVYHRGWVEHTVPVAVRVIGEIAMLRIDVDLYSATRVCLEHFLPRLNGYLIVDDLNLAGCRKAVQEFMDLDGFIEIDNQGCAYRRV